MSVGSAPAALEQQDRRPLRQPADAGVRLRAEGQPAVWLCAGGLVLSLAMIVGLMLLVFVQGAGTFWPAPLHEITLRDGSRVMGEVTRHDTFDDGDTSYRRELVRIGNFELTDEHFRWVDEPDIAERGLPEWGLVVERQTWGRFYGFPLRFVVDGEVVASEPAAVWQQFLAVHGDVRARWEERRHIETEMIGDLSYMEEWARIDARTAAIRHGEGSDEHAEAIATWERAKEESARGGERARERIAELNAANDRYRLVLRTADGIEKELELTQVVRAYPANQLGFGGSVGVYLSRWGEFLAADPREANSEGGVFPAIFGTVLMTLVMSLVVMPFGVAAALYMREYAKPGLVVSTVRIAVNNLAGVPSIVFGVFGLGFFCYLVGGTLDEWLYPGKLPSPHFGTGGLLWSSLTLALLTLPVVIVSTEEALAAVPSSMREGSFACGATKWQTIRRIVLPRALPGIMTGLILAMARGAGEVAPLMLVGVVKLAPDLPFDSAYPFLHLERSFMHLGFHIYDLGFQSQNSEAAKPMVYTTTLLLITLIATLNGVAVLLRSRLRRRFQALNL